MFPEHRKNEIHIFTVMLYYDAMCDSDVAIFNTIKLNLRPFLLHKWSSHVECIESPKLCL